VNLPTSPSHARKKTIVKNPPFQVGTVALITISALMLLSGCERSAQTQPIAVLESIAAVGADVDATDSGEAVDDITADAPGEASADVLDEDGGDEDTAAPLGRRGASRDNPAPFGGGVAFSNGPLIMPGEEGRLVSSSSSVSNTYSHSVFFQEVINGIDETRSISGALYGTNGARCSFEAWGVQGGVWNGNMPIPAGRVWDTTLEGGIWDGYMLTTPFHPSDSECGAGFVPEYVYLECVDCLVTNARNQVHEVWLYRPEWMRSWRQCLRDGREEWC
jgi:hypothetical protein